MEKPGGKNKHTEIGRIGLFDTATLATAGVAFAVGIAPLGGLLICFVAVRTAWRWHHDGIVTLADKTLEDSVQTYQAVAALPQTARRVAARVQERAMHAAPAIVEPEKHAPAPASASTDLLSVLAGAHHLLVVGYTGGGKTTLMHGLARHLARQRACVVMIDPDAIAGAYPGYRVVGAADNFEDMGRALAIAKREIEKRRDARKSGQRTFNPVYLLVDEAHDVVSEVEGAWAVLETIIRRGRKLNVHAVIGTQDSQVKTLGLEGKSKLLENMMRVDMRLNAREKREAVVDGVVYNAPDLPSPDDTVKKASKPVSVPKTAVQKSKPAAQKTTETDPLLSSLLASVSSSSKDKTDTDTKPVSEKPKPVSNDDETAENVSIDSVIRLMVSSGNYSKNGVARWLAVKHGIRNKARAYAMINAALDGAEIEDPPAPFGFLNDSEPF